MRRVALLLLLGTMTPGCFFARFYSTPWPEPVEVIRVKTADGWSLDLRHVAPQGGKPHARPVVLMHGIVANGRNMDLDDKHSIARDLSRRGFDVWVPSLRNVGLSEHRWLPSLTAAESNFDAYVTQDLPAVLAEVRKRSGAEQVDYVGHSMGGLILYAYLSRGGTDIARGVTLGSPARLRWSGHIESVARAARSLAVLGSWIPIQASAQSTLPAQGETDSLPERMLLGPETLPATWRSLVADSVDDLPSGVLDQFAGWLVTDRFDSADHSIDYLEGLSSVRIPMFVVAGKTDGMAPPWTVRPAFDRLGSPRKQWLVLGEANGQAADYNHMDIVLGEHAHHDVFDRIAAFLEGK